MVESIPVKGVVVSIPTFKSEEYEVRYDRIEDHVNWLIEKGIKKGDGIIMAAGGLGEGYFLSDDEHRNVMKSLAEAADGRVPTMAGLFELDGRAAVKKAKYAEEVGVDLLQVNPPHYTKPADDEVYTYYKMINDAANVGIVIYNTPWCTNGYEIRAHLMERLIELENLAGMKWSSWDYRNFIEVLDKFAAKLPFIDNMGSMDGYIRGMKGYISHIANFNPEIELKQWGLFKKGNFREYMKERGRINAYRSVLSAAEDISTENVGEGTWVSGSLEAAGMDIGPPFPPQAKMTKDQIALLRAAMKKSGII